MAAMKVPFMDLNRTHNPIRAEINKAVARVIDNNSYILGKEVEKFEEDFARYCGAKYAAGVATGTDALELIVRAYGISKEGLGEIITAPNSFIATASAIDFSGAWPVFADCGRDYLIGVAEAEKQMSPDTRAIMPVHLYGQAADMTAIKALAQKRKLLVIEDACQAHGAEYNGVKTGNLGDAAAFSFYPGKNLGGMGDGGIVVSNDKGLIDEVKMLRNYGQREKYHHVTEGFNRRLDALQAAILSVKLKYLDEWNNQRREVARRYDSNLKGLDKVVQTPIIYGDRKHVYHIYVIRTLEREELQKHLKERGVDTGLHYPIPIHLQPSFSKFGYKQGDFPRTERYAKEMLSLPMFPGMTDEEADYVCDSVGEFFNKSSSTKSF